MTSSASTSTSDVPAGFTRMRVMLYSDNATTRAQVRRAVGDRPGAQPIHVDWDEVATPVVASQKAADGGYDLIILDGETGKVGGMGLCRQFKNEVYQCPPVLVLIARPQDAWLASWSLADAVALMPPDPTGLEDQVARLLTGAAA